MSTNNNETHEQSHIVKLAWLFVGCTLLLFTFATFAVWLGFLPAFLAYFIAFCIAGLLYGVNKGVDRWHHHQDRNHLRLMSQQALAAGHSLELEFPSGHKMRSISPWTIPDNIKQTINNTGVPALPAPAQYPVAPRFAEMRSLIKPGRLILGYNTQGPITGDVDDLLSMAFVGKPGTGKSTGLLYYLAVLLLVDAQVFVFDPQGSLYDVSDLMPYYGETDEIYNAVPAIYEEIDEREELWRQRHITRKPLLLLVDELPFIARYEEKYKPSASVLDLAEKIVTQNRKHNCYCMLTGTSLPAQVLPTLTRDNLSSRLVFNSSDMHARMAGLDEESRKKLLPLLRKAQPGIAILDVSRRPQPDIAALPFTTVDDLRSIIAGNDSDVPEAFPAWQAVPDDRNGNGNGVPVSFEERERIIQLAKDGVPRREMCLAMGKGKHYYETIKQVLDAYESEE